MAPTRRLRIFVTLLFTCLPSRAQVSVLTANCGNERTNANALESVLNPSNVNGQLFGRLAVLPVDGQIYAQPLIFAGPSGNILYVATMHNSVYAFNADDLSTTTPIWTRNLGQPVPSTFLQFRDILPEVGILSTPVIDRSRNTIYVVTDTFKNETAEFHLHALDLTDGSEKPGSPVVINASVIGDGDQSDNGTIPFDASQHLQRPSLLLSNNRLYIAFGSHAHQYPYHGWLLAHDADNITKQTAV